MRKQNKWKKELKLIKKLQILLYQMPFHLDYNIIWELKKNMNMKKVMKIIQMMIVVTKNMVLENISIDLLIYLFFVIKNI